MDERLASGAAAPANLIALDVLDGLIVELTPLLWHVARATGLSAQDAEDVVQTSWTRLLTHLGTIREPGAVTAWLVTTTRREAWKVAGQRRTEVDHDWLTTLPDPEESLEERVVLNEEQRELWAALRTLPPRCQELLRIVAFVPRPDYDAVATRLGMRRGSIGPTRRRCLDQLGQALRAEDGDS